MKLSGHLSEGIPAARLTHFNPEKKNLRTTYTSFIERDTRGSVTMTQWQLSVC
jgi:hypothetical protein